MTTLVLADHDNKELGEDTARAVTAALQIGEPVHVLVAGRNCESVVQAAATLSGVEKVISVEHDHYQHMLAEPLTELIVSLAAPYSTILGPATALGKSVLPRVAALIDVMQISEIIKVVSGDTFERSIYAGNAIQVVQTTDSKKVITVRTSAFPAAACNGSADIVTAPAGTNDGSSVFKSESIAKSDRPELSSAQIIISGGRSLGSAENFKKFIEPVAVRLGAAIGASRAAVDAGYAPNNLQVGQTGKVVAPDLYIAVGISGAIQHLAGMKDSKTIVAINNDPDAPIFSVADFGLVTDLFIALPELEKALAKVSD